MNRILLCVPATLTLALVPGSVQEPIELEVNPDTKMPIGPRVEPRGALLDPRDLPEELHPYFEIVRGLEGFDQSLTGLFARYLAFVVERKNLDREYRQHAEALRDDWNEQVGALIDGLDAEQPEVWVAAAIHHDTGRRLLEDPDRVRVERAPRIRFATCGMEEFEELSGLEASIERLGPEMGKDEAEALKEAVSAREPYKVEDPWFGHAFSQLIFLSLGQYNRELVVGNPWELTEEQYLDRCRNALRNELLTARTPALPEEEAAGGLFFLEGWAVARVAGKIGDDDWEAPESLIEYDEATERPLLLIQVPDAKRYDAKAKLKRIQIGMLVGGEQRVLYSGAWPLK